MIDALAAILRLLSNDAELTSLIGDQLAEQHKFAQDAKGWPTPSKALQVREDGGGSADLYVGWQTPRLEARCYGERPSEAKRVYSRLVAICRQTERAVVTTAEGNALIYWLHIEGSPLMTYDVDLGIDVLTIGLRAAVAEEPVP